MAAKHSASPTSYRAFFHGLDPSRPLAFALGMALLPHLEGLFPASAWCDGSTSAAMVKEI
jgi:hypothetical protein